MKLHLSNDNRLNLCSAYGEGYVEINKIRHTRNVILLPDRLIPDWTSASFATLTEADFVQLATLAKEAELQVLLLGTGPKLRFPSPALMRPLIEANIGLEVMDIAAACRTYNILASEDRSVAAALLLA